MTVGLLIILKPSRSRFRRHWGREWGHEWREEFENHRREHHRREHQWRQHVPDPNLGPEREGYSSEDFIDATSIFGGVHKKVMSKNFKGGDITTIMGGSEIDLTQADFTGTARLDVTQIMGGTKIIVPAHWEVRSEVTAIFAGFEDKRQQPVVTNPDKVLIIDGTSIFGGIELRNY
jgi:predicted membrane protein